MPGVDKTQASDLASNDPDSIAVTDSPKKTAKVIDIEPKTEPKKVPPVKVIRKRKRKKSGGKASTRGATTFPFPKHPLSRCIRIPQAILEQNAGRECKYREAAAFAKLSYKGEVAVEISSALKFGLLERVAQGTVRPTDLVRKIVRPQKPDDRIEALREAVLKAPVISDVYKHFRGENLPEREFLVNAVVDTFKVPPDKAGTFIMTFLETLKDAELLEEVGGKTRVVDITHAADAGNTVGEEQLRKLGKAVSVSPTDGCFVMMPFAAPVGGYFNSVYEPAIRKAGLTPIRADADIFGTGKIIDQIWSGIRNARVLVAELTGRNPNVLYELGLAHALRVPVVLVSSNEEDVPFDVRHVRVIYYDVMDPFWGNKLIDKVAENILSALKNPDEAILFQK
jgi:hypothetical protein